MMINTQKGCSFYTDEEIDLNNFDLDIAPINNHSCKELMVFQAMQQKSSCIPRIDKDGFIEACDDTNPVRINYCPFCGFKIYE